MAALPSTVRRYETWLCSVFSAAGAVSPQTRVDQAAGTDDLAGVQGQGGQNGLPPQPADRQHLAAVHDIDRSQ